ALEVLNQVVLNTGSAPGKESRAYLARARHFLATHQTEKASEDVDAAVRDDPAGVMPRLMAAEISLEANKPDEARIHLSRIDPGQRKDVRNDLMIRTLEGRIDLAESSPEAAILTWRTGLLEVGGNDVDLTWRLANVLLENGRVSEAEPLMNQYRRLVGGDDPDHPYLYLNALAMLKSNRPAEAAAQFEKMRYKAPKYLEPLVLYALGQCYEATRNTPRALDAYRQASESLPRSSAPRKALARLQAATKPQEAQATLQKGLSLNPESAELLTARAEFLYLEQMKKPADQRSFREVEALLDRASRSDPRSATVALFRAQVFADTGRPEDALERLKAATGLTPRTPSLWLAWANLLTALNRLGEAQDVLGQATRAAGPQAIFYVTRANVLIKQGHLVDARKVLVEGLDRVPREQKSQVWKTLGDFYQ
ncbi:MAG: tetratricopeptide repeat protein, partial [Planctomycetia bacterium]|nr:tetratricopeptide repeat protein [Planctomycetia bacterium]